MKVICDNCRAVYKIPDDKLLKPVNKATCRKCGHRMLIPRPRVGASPDEKTLVTAVPPTPPPAPGREVGPPTTPMDDDPENTMPGVPETAPSASPGRRVAGPTDDVPLYAATPMPSPDRDARPSGVSGRSAPPPAPDLSYAGATPAGSWRTATPAGVQRLPAEPARRTPAPVPRSMAPEIAPPQMIDATGTPAPSRQRSGTPAPASRAPTPTPQQPRQSFTPTPPAARPAPALQAPIVAPSYPSVATNIHHDPSSDLLVAVIGVSGAMLGALVLVTAFATTAGTLPISTLVLIAVGMLLAFGGGLATLLVILTGSRGRRPARPLLALVFGGGLGAVVTVTAVGLFVAKDQILAGGGLAIPGQTAVAPGTPGKPVDEPVIATAVPEAPVEAPVVAPEVAAAAVAAAAEVPAKPSGSTSSRSSSGSSRASSEPVAETFQPRTTSTSGSSGSTSSTGSSKASTSGSSSSSARVAPPPVEEDDFLIDEPDPEPEPVSSLPASVPDDIIDTILRNNLDLKKCFFSHKKATGTLPARVTVGFQLEPSGKIRDAGVVDEEFKGTELDACLARTVNAIQMPPSSGATRRVKYPFQLQ